MSDDRTVMSSGSGTQPPANQTGGVPVMRKFCPNCGNPLTDNLKFCGRCGTPLTPGAVPPPQPAAYAPPPMQQAPFQQPPRPQYQGYPPPQPGYPPYPNYPGYAKAPKAGLKLGHKISFSGALLAIISFFLPWVMVSCNGQTLAEMSGWQLSVGSVDMQALGTSDVGQGSPILFVVLFAAILVIGLIVFIFFKGRIGKVDAPVLIGLSAVAMLVLVVYLISSSSDIQGGEYGIEVKPMIGLFTIFIGYLAVLVGGVFCFRE